MINSQKDIVKYFNEQMVGANKSILKNQQEQTSKLQQTENLLFKVMERKN